MCQGRYAHLTLNLSRGGPSCTFRLHTITLSAGYCSASSLIVSLCSSELSGGEGAFPAAAALLPSASAASIRRPLTSNSHEGGSAGGHARMGIPPMSCCYRVAP